MRAWSIFLAAVCFTAKVIANTEKLIFIAPSAIAIEDFHASLKDLDIASLSPLQTSIRLRTPVAFPSPNQPKGLESWYLLNDLKPGQRYEVRVCWAAIEPTEFWLYAHPVSALFDNSVLLAALTSYSENRAEQGYPSPAEGGLQFTSSESRRSTLLLQVFAAADFFTSNKTLMQSPPPVLIDLILDPYVLNVFPRSLGPTAVYVVIVAIISWYVAGFVWRWLLELSQTDVKQHEE